MSGFLGWLFGAKEKIQVEAEKAAPLVDDAPLAVDDEIRAMRQWLGSVESRLNEVERTLEEWSGE